MNILSCLANELFKFVFLEKRRQKKKIKKLYKM